MDKLNPCRKCGSRNVHLVNEDWWPDNGDYWPVVWCKDCGHNINDPKSVERAIEKWNQ